MTVFQNLWLVFCRVWSEMVDPHVTFIFFPFGLENEQCIIKLKARGLSNVSWSEIYIYIKEWIQSPWYGIEALICYRVSRSQTSKKIKQISDLFWNSSRYSRNIFIMLFRHPYLWANPKGIPIGKLKTHIHTHREGGGREGDKEREIPTSLFFFWECKPPISSLHFLLHTYTPRSDKSQNSLWQQLFPSTRPPIHYSSNMKQRDSVVASNRMLQYVDSSL